MSNVDPVEFVPASPGIDSERTRCPEAYRGRVHVLTLHDGDRVPDEVAAVDAVAAMERSGELDRAVADVRDWGADLVAHHLVSALGLRDHARVRVARAVVDFNRFPGRTRPGSSHVDRLALGGPVGEAMGHEVRRLTLERYYDGISEALERLILDGLILISVHTYDEHNASATRRPEVSVLSRSDSYQQHSRLPFGLFDPLFPDVLVESSAKRVLRDRLGLTLEKAGYYVEHNYPYCLPDGSLEIRSQPWFFFHRLRQAFELAHPETTGDPAYAQIWEMLFNTNLRGADSSALNRYLHRYCAAPSGREREFFEAGKAYSIIRDHLRAQPEFVERYRRSPDRTSAITIEVRKDLVWRYEDGRPVGPKDDAARRVGDVIAEGIATFLRTDLPQTTD